MQYEVTHKTQYKYNSFVTGYHSILCLKPRALDHQTCLAYELEIWPEPEEIVPRTDYYGNETHYFSVQTPHKELVVLSKSRVEVVSVETGYLFQHITCLATKEMIARDADLRSGLLDYIIPSHYVKWDNSVKDFARPFFLEDKSLYEAVRDLCHHIFSNFTFLPNFTTISTPVISFLKERKGVCQDYSHLAIACLRSMGFAARYVSGYLETLPPPGKPKLQGSDASHAWISVYIPELGWCDFDPTNDMVPGERHITVAWGRDYGDVAPLKGVIFSSGKQKLDVSVDVIPVVT